MSTSSTSVEDKKDEDSGENVTKQIDLKGFIVAYLSTIIGIFFVFLMGGIGLYTTKVVQSNILPDSSQLPPFKDTGKDTNGKDIDIDLDLDIKLVDMHIIRPTFFADYNECYSQKCLFNAPDFYNSFKTNFITCGMKQNAVYGKSSANLCLYLSDVYPSIVAMNFYIIKILFNVIGFIPEELIMVLFTFCFFYYLMFLYFANLAIGIFFHITKFSKCFEKIEPKDENVTGGGKENTKLTTEGLGKGLGDVDTKMAHVTGNIDNVNNPIGKSAAQAELAASLTNDLKKDPKGFLKNVALEGAQLTFWGRISLLIWKVVLFFTYFMAACISTFVMPIYFTAYSFFIPLTVTFKQLKASDFESPNAKIKVTNDSKQSGGLFNLFSSKSKVKKEKEKKPEYFGFYKFFMDSFRYKKVFFMILATITLIQSSVSYLGYASLICVAIAVGYAYYKKLYHIDLDDKQLFALDFTKIGNKLKIPLDKVSIKFKCNPPPGAQLKTPTPEADTSEADTSEADTSVEDTSVEDTSEADTSVEDTPVETGKTETPTPVEDTPGKAKDTPVETGKTETPTPVEDTPGKAKETTPVETGKAKETTPVETEKTETPVKAEETPVKAEETQVKTSKPPSSGGNKSVITYMKGGKSKGKGLTPTKTYQFRLV